MTSNAQKSTEKTAKSRVQAGVPSGGQFATSPHAEADVTLAYTVQAGAQSEPVKQRPDPMRARPATRDKVNELLEPGSRWRQLNVFSDRTGDVVDEHGHVVTIRGHAENYISVEYPDGRGGGPFVKATTFGTDSDDNVYLFRNGRADLVYTREP